MFQRPKWGAPSKSNQVYIRSALRLNSHLSFRLQAGQCAFHLLQRLAPRLRDVLIGAFRSAERRYRSQAACARRIIASIMAWCDQAGAGTSTLPSPGVLLCALGFTAVIG